MKRFLSLLIFLLLSTYALKLSAAQKGKGKRPQTSFHPSFAEVVTKDQKAPQNKKTRSKKVVSNRIKTPGPITDLPFPEVSADYSSSSEDECETTKERHTKKRIKDLAKKAATQAIVAAIAVKTPLVVIAEEKDEDTAESIRTLFKDAETSPEKTPQEVADELGVKRDKLAEQVLKKRTIKKAKIAEIYPAESAMSYTDRDAKAALVILQSAEKASVLALTQANKARRLAIEDPTGNYYVDYYNTQFLTAQNALQVAKKAHEEADEAHRSLVYKTMATKIELADIITAKKDLVAQRNQIADKRKVHVTKHSIPSASYFWSLAGYRSDDELVDSDAEEMGAGAALPATEEEFGPLQGCLTATQALALTNK